MTQDEVGDRLAIPALRYDNFMLFDYVLAEASRITDHGIIVKQVITRRILRKTALPS